MRIGGNICEVKKEREPGETGRAGRPQCMYDTYDGVGVGRGLERGSKLRNFCQVKIALWESRLWYKNADSFRVQQLRLSVN